jgi:tetratricopeptide (TPR) repeat protein
MPFAIACPACKSSLRVAAELRGQKCACPHCGQRFLVGGAAVPQRAAVRPAAAIPPATAPRPRLLPWCLVGAALLVLAAGLSWPLFSRAPRQGEPAAAVTDEQRPEPTGLRGRRPDGPDPAITPKPRPTSNTPPAAQPETRADEAQDPYKLGVQAAGCLDKGQPGEALKLAEQAVRLQPQNAWYHGLVGAAHWQLKEYPAGLEECETAIRLAAGKDDAWYYHMAGENAFAANNYLLARKYFEQAVARGEQQLGGNFKVAQARLFTLPVKLEPNAALKVNPFQGARRAEVPEICKRAVETYFIAEAQYRAGEFQAARATLDSLWKQYPAGSQVWVDAFAASELMARHANLHFGDPPAYYSLRRPASPFWGPSPTAKPASWAATSTSPRSAWQRWPRRS